ncbi:DUF5908 family protein [Leeuwenhoekiella parthenopeia]|uniref:DUF5908 family protein n=1 Tax=Leeuwenhoekiella parthenopeia TaxID=2890320 RepID=A0ABS8GRL3_9FLAO|nr:DUF5908 family protein [Leeuwenhoekiella parthenopeia]MCC4212600.1 DUF5908 family protein [Leeuwenhoekiella parthenopeia]
MPIEIKELHIKINVSDDAQSTASASRSPEAKKEAIIQACLEQVMQIDKRKNER